MLNLFPVFFISIICVQSLINQGRQKVIEATNALKTLPREPLEDTISKVVSVQNLSVLSKEVLLMKAHSVTGLVVVVIELVLSPQWTENPSLTETQVQSIALGRHATVELEIKHREAVYRDVLNRQQTVRTAL